MPAEADLSRRLAGVHTALLCDSLDALGFRDSAFGPAIQARGEVDSVVGRAFTLKCEPAERVPDTPFEQLVAAFDHLSAGEVIVIQTGDQISAMWGELLSTAAMAAGVRGAILDGLIRDLDDIDEMRFPVFGTGVSPLDSAGRQDAVAFDVPIRCGTAEVRPGDWIVGDRMGVVVLPAELAAEAVSRAEQKMRAESTVRDELARGDSLARVFERHGIL